MSSGLNRIEIHRDAQGARVVRRWAPLPLAQWLGMDPPTEVAAQRLAAAQGLAPAVFEFDPVEGSLSMAFIEGDRLEADWMHRAERIALLVQAVQRLRAIPAVNLPLLDLPARLLELQARLASIDAIAGRRWAVPVQHCIRAWEASCAAADGSGVADVLVHGDLGPHNIIVQADGSACLIDWEYAHRGHPDEDLAGLGALLSSDAPAAATLASACIEPRSFAVRVQLRRVLDDVWRELALASAV